MIFHACRINKIQEYWYFSKDNLSPFPSFCVYYWHFDTCRFWLGLYWADAHSWHMGAVDRHWTSLHKHFFPFGKELNIAIYPVCFFQITLCMSFLSINMIIRKFILHTLPFFKSRIQCYWLLFLPVIPF